jgi:hypothetical protein
MHAIFSVHPSAIGFFYPVGSEIDRLGADFLWCYCSED